MDHRITLERFTGGQWLEVGGTKLLGDPAAGIGTPSVTGYLTDYAIDHLDRRDAAALSAALPVSLDAHRLPRWPAFLVDLVPQGFGRAELLRRLALPTETGREADWPLLLAGAGNPIGHLRVREAYAWLQERAGAAAASAGFTFEEVAERSDEFIALLQTYDMFVAGSSGVQGEWPKLLLTEDAAGRLHLDHALPDTHARKHWLVKFGRGEDERLARILELEAPYMHLARRLGARVHGDLTLLQKALFIPRFDRRLGAGGVERIAQESLAAALGIADFGVSVRHEVAVEMLARVTSEPEAEIVEYVRRDVLNYALGNRDNHARNTALQRFEDGTIRLTPLFDFAPMVLHREGIPRQSRWDQEPNTGPDWVRVIEHCREVSGLELPRLAPALRELRTLFEDLPEHAAEAGVDHDILERQRHAIAATREALAAV